MEESKPEVSSNKPAADQASLQSYDLSALMSQTRILAADYRHQTGHALPVTEELARFDAINIFGLDKITDQDGIDACDTADSEVSDQNSVKDSYLIKGRVIFKAGKARQKLGKLGLTANWTVLLMVIYDAEYLPMQIYSVQRSIIEQELGKLSQDKRGSMTIAKYKAIGDLVWDNSSQS